MMNSQQLETYGFGDGLRQYATLVVSAMLLATCTLSSAHPVPPSSQVSASYGIRMTDWTVDGDSLGTDADSVSLLYGVPWKLRGNHDCDDRLSLKQRWLEGNNGRVIGI